MLSELERALNSPLTSDETQVLFEIDEIFFSRTDQRGVIQAGNSVFQRISVFPWDELLGAPHKVIRHPDMPRGVFWLLWETIQAGRPIGVYVKNRTAEGSHYWVFAVVTPSKDGYLSVRIKPTTNTFELIKDEYAALLEAEQTKELQPAESAAILLERIKELGFSDYAEFSTKALCDELMARDGACDDGPDTRLARFRAMAEAMAGIQTEAGDMSATFETIRALPANMRIFASRLEPSGGPISAISVNYADLSEQVSSFVRDFLTNGEGTFRLTRAAITEAMFVTCAARLQTDVKRVMAGESDLGKYIDVAQENKHLDEQIDLCTKMARDALTRVSSGTNALSRSMTVMKRHVTALGSTRMVCRVESARLVDGGGGLGEVVRRLDDFQVRIENQMLNINDLNRVVQDNAEVLSQPA